MEKSSTPTSLEIRRLRCTNKQMNKQEIVASNARTSKRTVSDG